MTTIESRFTTSGACSSLTADGLSLLLYPATELEAGPCQVWLRRRGRTSVRAHGLTGPASGSTAAGPVVRGAWEGLEYVAWFEGVGSGYCWQWRVRNTGSERATVDVVFTQDVALTAWEELRRNEYYVSQYLDLTPVETATGTALAVRQNMPDTGHPWLAVASLTGTAGWATDALQLHGPAGGLSLDRDLPGERLQHEHTLAALQAPAVTLAPGEQASGGFAGLFVAQHPDASGPADAAAIEAFLAEGGWSSEPPSEGDAGRPSVATLFAPAVLREGRLPTWEDVDVALPGERRLVEEGPEGEVWSAFVGDAHVVGLGKERAVLRPHGHVMVAAPAATASDDVVASTVWLDGVFCSQLTRGHASGTPGVGLRRSYLGLSLAAGVRVAVAAEDGGWALLGRPSLWVQRLEDCEWHYLLDDGGSGVVVTSRVTPHGVRMEVRCDPGTRVLVAVQAEGDGLVLASEAGEFTDNAALFDDGASRNLGWRCLVAESAGVVGVDLRVGGPAPDGPGTSETHDIARPGTFSWRLPKLSGGAGVAEVDAMLGWLAHDAAVHFQAPRGLEQYTGGAWGTRDVSQGPVGLLMATGEYAALRETLLAVFAGQQDDGDWPQWFDYLPAIAGPGHRSSHGDVAYWPLLALGEYLLSTGDADILTERVRLVGDAAFGDPTPVLDHVERAVARLASRRTRDPRLPAYGHGDWNDSLQPARPELASHMCSAWTSVLEIESLRTLREGLVQAGAAGRAGDLVARLAAIEDATTHALGEVLLADGELAGYAVFDGEEPELLVHPRDDRTSLAHGSLQVIHAIIAEWFTPEEARHHVELADAHLQGPHGIYLFDRPIPYAGGVQRVFKRAEAATFWGREIGLMYTHAHLRWVEALTHLGEGRRAWQEMLRAVPIGLTDRVAGARPRQATCYYSSADAVFADRYEAETRAEDLFDPTTPFEGGWRVYSSGPGLMLRLLTERLLGVRFRAAGVEIDPVLGPEHDGLVADLPVPGSGTAQVTYRVGPLGHGVHRVTVDGVEVTGVPLEARYRNPGVRLPAGAVTAGSRVVVETS